MKKTIYVMAALAMMAGFVACQKETVKETETPSNNASLLPETITATLADDITKTAYDADGKFSWVSNDAVRLIVVNAGSTTGSPQGYSTYYASNITVDGKTATFKNGDNQLVGFTPGTYESTGIAIYPSRLARPSAGGTESHGYGKPFVTIPEQGKDNVSGLASEIILTGVAKSDNSNFQFTTAMAVLKITVKNIPAEATALKLSTTNKANYPIDGDFVLEKNADGIVVFTPAQHQDYYGSPTGNGYLRVDLSEEGIIDSRDFYFNVPIADYPAGTLKLTLEDENGDPTLLSKTIGKELKLQRNDCLSLPSLIANTITIDRNATTPILKFVNESGTMVRVHISQSVLTPSNYNSGDWKEGNKFSDPSGSYNLYNLTNKNSQKFLTSTDNYYLNYITLQSSNTSIPESLTASNVVNYGSIPFYYIEKSTNRIQLSDCVVTASSQEGSEGPLADMYDGNTGTYWHSRWSSNANGYHNYSPEYGVYIDIELPTGKTLTKFQFIYSIRSTNNNGRPREVVYAYSNDGTNWTRISGATATSDMDAAAGAWVSLPYKEIPAAAHYLRFGITKAGDGPNWLTGGGSSTALGELQLYGEYSR